jgi:hypothetical protein
MCLEGNNINFRILLNLIDFMGQGTKSVGEMRKEIAGDRELNEDYFWRNIDMICHVYEKHFITIHKNSSGERVIVAHETEEARKNYLKRIDVITRFGAYVRSGRITGREKDQIV